MTSNDDISTISQSSPVSTRTLRVPTPHPPSDNKTPSSLTHNPEPYNAPTQKTAMTTSSKTQPPTSATTHATGPITLPRVTITFCTQCKWNLRAAYYAQELLQTFGTSLGEVALVPATGGTFVVELFHNAAEAGAEEQQLGGIEGDGGGGGEGNQAAVATVDEAGNTLGPASGGQSAKSGWTVGREAREVEVKRTVVWDRKMDGGFPETKVLKGRIRDLVEPDRGLGHTDRALRKDREGGGQVHMEEKQGKREDGRDAEGNAEGNTGSRRQDEGKDDCEDCR